MPRPNCFEQGAVTLSLSFDLLDKSNVMLMGDNVQRVRTRPPSSITTLTQRRTPRQLHRRRCPSAP